MTAAEDARNRQQRICAEKDRIQAELNNMSTPTEAEAYMQLALLATKARDAGAALDEATGRAAQVHAATVAAQSSHNIAVAQQGQAAARPVAGAPAHAAIQHLQISDDETIQADLDMAGILHQQARTTATEADSAVTEAISVIESDAVDNALTASRATANASNQASQMPGDIAAAVALPVPASCTNPGAFAAHVATLQAQAPHVGGAAAASSVAGGNLGGPADAASAVVTPQRNGLDQGGAAPGLRVRNAEQQAKPINQQAAVRTDTWNHFTQDIGRATSLLNDNATLAGDAVTESNLANTAIQNLDAPAQALPAAIAPLRAQLRAIEDAARDASQLIPYDPADNSRRASGTMDILAGVEAEMEHLNDDLAKANRDSSRNADQKQREAEVAKLKRKLVGKKMTVKNAIKDAQGTYSGGLVMKCAWVIGEPTAVQNAKDRRDRATARLERTKSEPTEFAAVEDAHRRARQCLDQARQATKQAAQRRVDQLKAEGHGPQRHEGEPTMDAMRRRAVYRIDPESGTQIDSESGGLHNADPSASKFKSNEVYVKAEALARERANAARALDPAADLATDVPFSDIGDDIAEGVTCNHRPPLVATQLGSTQQIPTLPGFVYGAGNPPPTAAQMDTAAMQPALNATVPVVYQDDAFAKAILREDINGNFYLRTMWPQNP